MDWPNEQGGTLLRPKDKVRSAELIAVLQAFHEQKYPLPGIQRQDARQVLVEQMLESMHRIEYVARIQERPISPKRTDPTSDVFDPLKAAILHDRGGAIDEAFWLVFIFVHFGKHAKTGWRLARDVYGGLGTEPWVWARISANPAAFREWLAVHQHALKGGDGIARHFGNHRKYQSLDASSPTGTGAAFTSYVEWVGPTKTHPARIQQATAASGGNPRQLFDHLYRSMAAVKSFGRMARFDYLTMVGKLGLAPIEPGSTYMQGATGPVAGARLLFGDNRGMLSASSLDSRLIQLGAFAGVGMQVLEDALCNWQKSPYKFQPFRG